LRAIWDVDARRGDGDRAGLRAAGFRRGDEAGRIAGRRRADKP